MTTWLEMEDEIKRLKEENERLKSDKDAVIAALKMAAPSLPTREALFDAVDNGHRLDEWFKLEELFDVTDLREVLPAVLALRQQIQQQQGEIERLQGVEKIRNSLRQAINNSQLSDDCKESCDRNGHAEDCKQWDFADRFDRIAADNLALREKARQLEEELERWRVYHADDEPSWKHAAEKREIENSILRSHLTTAAETLTALKLRIHFIGWPREPRLEDGITPDWSKEIALLESTQERLRSALGVEVEKK